MASSSVSHSNETDPRRLSITTERRIKALRPPKLQNLPSFSSGLGNRAYSISTPTQLIPSSVIKQASSRSKSPKGKLKQYSVIKSIGSPDSSPQSSPVETAFSAEDWSTCRHFAETPATEIEPQFHFQSDPAKLPSLRSTCKPVATKLTSGKIEGLYQLDLKEQQDPKAYMIPFWDVKPDKMILSQIHRKSKNHSDQVDSDGVLIECKSPKMDAENAKKSTEQCFSSDRTLGNLPFSIRNKIFMYACQPLEGQEKPPIDAEAKSFPPYHRQASPIVLESPYNTAEQTKPPRIDPENFFRLTAAEKKAFYLSPHMNRIGSQSNLSRPFSTGPAALNPSIGASFFSSSGIYPVTEDDNSGFSSTEHKLNNFDGPMDLRAFQDFCSVAEPIPLHYYISVSLWDPTAYIESTEELLSLLQSPRQLSAHDPCYFGDVNCQLSTVLQKRNDILKKSGEWVTAMRALPRWVRKISLMAQIPFFLDRKDLEVNLVRMKHYASVRTGSRVRFELDISC